MENTKTNSFEYDLKRVDRVSIIIIWVIVALVIGQAFLQDPASGPENTIKAFPVGILATVVYFVHMNRFAKSLLFGLIPAVSICLAMAMDVFNLDKHYMLFAATTLIALYFDKKLLVVYGAIVDVLIAGLYMIAPSSLLGDLTTVPVILSVLMLFNAQIVILYFLTKWGRNILQNAVQKNEEALSLLQKLRESNNVEKKQSEYQQACVNKLLSNLKRIADGVLDCDFTLDDFDTDTGELYELHTAINASLKKSTETLKQMAFDVSVLSRAAQNGDLDKRAEAERYMGEYKKIVSGMNEALSNIQKPINDVSAFMAQISDGDLDGSIASAYSGEYNILITSVNATSANLKSIISDISSVLTRMADGDLKVNISADYKGRFSEIKSSLNYIIESFNRILHEIGGASSQVAMGTRQFSGSAQVLSQGATAQASAIETLTTSIAEIAEQTRKNAVHASEAKDLAVSVITTAEKGNGHLQEMLRSMDALNDSSRDISRIMKVIDDIAFQTNILALNAAVEAARAGVHGKGFAVVAEEVRNLAAKSADAARETASLIEGSIKGVENGLKIAQDTAGVFKEIMEGAEKTAALVATISEASGQQASGIGIVSTGIEQVSQVVESNSATAQQSAATSEELSGQADFLEKIANRFTLKQM